MPTQTYTASATWHNTSQYQQNGDVSDATVLQKTGEDALDNLAYLTGGASNSQIRQEATVADLAALKALTTQRDQDYFVLDSNKRKYQFDSGSAATADDYAVVQPTAGAGRYILINAVPKTTSKRWVKTALSWVIQNDDTSLVRDGANGRVRAGGSSPVANVFIAEFTDINPGDVISKIEVCGNGDIGAPDVAISATFYLISADTGATTPTIVNLGTVATTPGGGAQAVTATAAPLPITIPAATECDRVVAQISCDTTGAALQAYFYWVALEGTRSYITE